MVISRRNEPKGSVSRLYKFDIITVNYTIYLSEDCVVMVLIYTPFRGNMNSQ